MESDEELLKTGSPYFVGEGGGQLGEEESLLVCRIKSMCLH